MITMARLRSTSLIQVVLVSILPSLSSSQAPQQCRSPQETCMQYNYCPNIMAKIRSKEAELCGVRNHIQFVCCKNVDITPNFPTPAPIPPPTQAPLPSRENATKVALENCKKYQEYRFRIEWIDSPFIGQPPTPFKRMDCLQASPMIINGKKAAPKEYPHMASIGYGSKFKEVEWACGGSLISEKYILSAAHCGKTSVQGPPKWAKLGDLNVSSTTDDAKPAVYSIVKVHDHPSYNSSLATNDISLFELNATVEMSPHVRPACLSTSTSNPVGTEGIITGWGFIAAGEKGSDHLLKATIPTVEDRRCEDRFKSSYNSTTMICAGDLKAGKDTCGGDSGGPLQSEGAEECMWDIFGVTSYGDGICGTYEYPSVYTKVTFYLDWIQSIVWP